MLNTTTFFSKQSQQCVLFIFLDKIKIEIQIILMKSKQYCNPNNAVLTTLIFKNALLSTTGKLRITKENLR